MEQGDAQSRLTSPFNDRNRNKSLPLQSMCSGIVGFASEDSSAILARLVWSTQNGGPRLGVDFDKLSHFHSSPGLYSSPRRHVDVRGPASCSEVLGRCFGGKCRSLGEKLDARPGFPFGTESRLW